jgi:hypothetical protein
MVFSGDARHLTSYHSECQVSKKVKDIASSKAYFEELYAKQTANAKPNEIKVYKPFR